MTTTVGGHRVDLEAIRQRLEREMKDAPEIEGKAYHLHSLEFDGSQITIVIDLQFKPASAASGRLARR